MIKFDKLSLLNTKKHLNVRSDEFFLHKSERKCKKNSYRCWLPDSVADLGDLVESGVGAKWEVGAGNVVTETK